METAVLFEGKESCVIDERYAKRRRKRDAKCNTWHAGANNSLRLSFWRAWTLQSNALKKRKNLRVEVLNESYFFLSI
jgi:hypothetical protein